MNDRQFWEEFAKMWSEKIERQAPPKRQRPDESIYVPVNRRRFVFSDEGNKNLE